MFAPVFTPRALLKVLALLALSTTATMLAGCTTASTSSSSNTTANDSITTAWPVDVDSLNPFSEASGQDFEAGLNLYQQLVNQTYTKTSDGSYEFNLTSVTPGLASSWDMGPSSITFHLRTNVKFYPSGNPLTAADVKWSLGAMLTGANADDFKINGLQSVNNVQIINANTVRINLTDASGKPVPATQFILDDLADPTASIADSKVAKTHATASDPYAFKWLGSHVVGSGVYYLASRTPGQQMILKAVPDISPQPAIRTVTIRIVNSASMASLMLGGTINFAEYALSPTDLNKLQSSGFVVHSQPALAFDYLALASDTGPLSNVKVRQAIAYSIPYNQIISTVYFGRATRAYSDVPPSEAAYTPAWGIYTTNLTMAKKLMAEAGNPSISVGMHYDESTPAQQNLAVLIKESLSQIGIKLTLVPDTPAQLFSTIFSRATPNGTQPGPPAIVLWNWTPATNNPDVPIGYEATKGGLNNYSRWNNAVVDQINAQYQALPPSTARNNAYKHAQTIIAEAAPLIPIDITDRSDVTTKNLSGASFNVIQCVLYYKLQPTQ